MLVKLETKSNRVKGVAFHPKRPWVLASLHNGVLQLWDYRMGTMLDRYDEHDGPVRGVHFHQSQPLFVSGGDDYKIKVWNYKQRKCIFTLLGHLDYIRTVFFHHEYPWIISSSDDQTVRIWNWQSRQCIAILTGHNHYVMCAQFHPKEDMVVSCSLDQTIRVWDISGLRKKAAMPGPATFDDSANKQADLFGNGDAVVKYVLEGHDRGVNWCAFHPTLPLIVSAADDRQVKLWRMNDSKAWEMDTCRGHFNNVSCAIFHPRQELILSNSEDKSIRVWDMSKRVGVQTYRREHDRYWVIAAHPEHNLFAAGHDSGLIVFKLERERPAYTTQGDSVYYVKDKYLRCLDTASGRDVAVAGIRRSAGPNSAPRNLSYNQAEHAFLVCSRADGGTYELYQPPKDTKDMGDYVAEAKRGVGRAAVFVARNRFAVLDKANQIEIKNLKNELTKSFKVPGNVDSIYFAGTGAILLRCEDMLMLYDIQQKKVTAELLAPHVKYVIWSNDYNYVALMSKHSIVLATRKLEQLCTLHETVRIKSGAWDDMSIFAYTTLNHVKYALLNGDNGVIRTLDSPLYIVRSKGNSIHCLDRDGKARVLSVDPTEYRFKLALVNRKYDEVLSIIRSSNLVGQSIIAYLEKKGYPEIALLFVRDDLTRFNLALECGNLQVAQETAMAMDKEEIWSRLAAEALRLGNQHVVVTALRRIKHVQRLSFLYVILGDTEMLQKMLKIAEMRNDPMSRYENAVFLGDVDEQVKVLREAGQIQLAYLAARTHGLDQVADEIWTAAGNDPEKAPRPPAGELLVPPAPVLRHHELAWPQLNVAKSAFDISMSGGVSAPSAVAAATAQAAVTGLADADMGEVGEEWGGDELEGLNEDGEIKRPMKDEKEDAGEGGGWEIDDVVLEGADVAGGGVSGSKSIDMEMYFVPPTQGITDGEMWVRNSSLAADHIAGGDFDSAMQLLNQQAGIVNFAPLHSIFMTIYYGTRTALSENASVPSQLYPIHRNWEETKSRNWLPYQGNSLTRVVESLQNAYKLVTSGKFTEAIASFRSILYSTILLVVNTKQDLNEIQQLTTICREYILGLLMETARKEVASKEDSESQARNAELAAYFTHMGLQPIHLMLSLRSAMTVHFKIKNHVTASSFARRLLELGPKAEVATQARKLQAVCDKSPRDEVKLNYSEQNPFVMCGITFTPIYRGSKSASCPLCTAQFLPNLKGKVCTVCELALIGSESSGLKNVLERR